MSPEFNSALSQDLDHLTASLLFILVGAIITAIIFKYKKRSFVIGAFLGAVSTGVVVNLLNLTIYPMFALWAGLVIFLPKLNPESDKATQPSGQTSPRPIQAGTLQHPPTPNKNSIFISYRREDSAEAAGAFMTD